MNEHVIWLMDTDFCYNCNELADVDGLCWWCWEKIEEAERTAAEEEYWDEEDADDWDECAKELVS